MTDDTKVFSLVGQNLKLNTKADIQPYLDKLEQIDDLQEIHLGGNTFGVEACQAFAQVLKTKSSLKVADFADIFTGRLISEIPDALRALCDALIDNTNLVELNLSDNAFGGRSAEPMVNFLTNNHSFSILKLNNNGLGITGGTIVAQALIQAADNLKAKGLKSNLRTVICGRNRLENGSAPVWAKAYAAHGGLVEVRMFQNGIRMEGIEAISQGLASCPDLEILDLQDNTATLRGSRAIAACLPRWPKLKTLNLSDCLLKPKGGALVFAALANGTNKSLETIQVQYCDLDRKALAQLGSAIDQHLAKLTKLEINGNWADEEDDCIEDIKNALAKHGHQDALDELDEMDPEGEEDEDEQEEEEDEQEEADAELEKSQAAVVAKPDEADELADALSRATVTDDKIAAEPVAKAAHELHFDQAGGHGQSKLVKADEGKLHDTEVQRKQQLAPAEPAHRPVPAAAIADITNSGETVDLFGELLTKPVKYIPGVASAIALASSTSDKPPASAQVSPQAAEPSARKKRAFRAAWGAIRKLLN